MESETDRVLADELRGILKDLRDKNKKLTDEKDKGKAFVWIVVVLAVALVIALTGGSDSHHHYHRY